MLQSEIRTMLETLSNMKVDLAYLSDKVEDMKEEYEEGTAQEEDLQGVVKALDSADDEIDKAIQKILSFKA